MLTPLSFPGPPRGALPLPTGASGHHLLGYAFHSHSHSGVLAGGLQDGLPTGGPAVWEEGSVPRGLQDSHPTGIQTGVPALLPNGDPTGLPRHLAARRPGDLQARLAHCGVGAAAASGTLGPVFAATAGRPGLGAAPERHADQTGAG